MGHGEQWTGRNFSFHFANRNRNPNARNWNVIRAIRQPTSSEFRKTKSQLKEVRGKPGEATDVVDDLLTRAVPLEANRERSRDGVYFILSSRGLPSLHSAVKSLDLLRGKILRL